MTRQNLFQNLSSRARIGRILSTAPALAFVIAAISTLTTATMQAQGEAAPVIIDASRFLDTLPEQHEIVGASRGEWLFNNLAVRATTRHNLFARFEVPKSGTYYGYIRSSGGSFRLAIDDQVTGEAIAHDSMALRRVGEFDLTAGPAGVHLMGIDGNPVIDVIVLSQREDLTEEELLPHQFDPEVKLLHDYPIPPNTSAVKFGDLTGDGRMDFAVITNNFSAIAFDNDGTELWRWETVGDTKEHEAPGLVWDINHDGRAEVIHWRLIDGQELLVIADGRTGRVLHQAPWPTQAMPHDWSNYRLAIANFGSGYPDSIVVFTDSGRYAEQQGYISIAAYDATLQLLWRHQEDKLKDHLGHYVYPIDLTSDGTDEVIVSALVLDSKGAEMWNRFDYHFRNREHMDSIRFTDLTGDGQVEMVAASSDMGLQVFESLTGKLLWHHNAEHTQQVETGDFLAADVQTPHIAVGARTYDPLSSQLWWFSPDGRLLSKWPANRISGNPELVKGDWYGDGSEVLFWHRFRMNDEGKGELYFPGPVYHMFDFIGNGSEQVIVRDRRMLRVYGYSAAPEGEALRTPEYLKTDVANHTHY